MAEQLTEVQCQQGNIVERILKKLVFDRATPDNVEVLVSLKMWGECIIHGGQIVHLKSGVPPSIATKEQLYFGDFKLSLGNIDNDFEIVFIGE